MSNYWKQALVLGGILWLFSLLLELWGSWGLLLVELGLSVLLLLFLIPLNWLVPIKWIDKLINKHPIVATMLASVGWLPYFTALLALISSGIAMFLSSESENMATLATVVVNVALLRKFVAVLVVMVVLVMLLVYGKSIAGQLNNHYKVLANATKSNIKVEASKVAEVKKEDKNQVVKKATTKRTVATKKKVAKPVTKKVIKKVAKPATKKVVKAKTTKAKKTTPKKSAKK